MSLSGGPKRYLLACDFDQTLSLNDTGLTLSELLGIPGFHDKVAGLSRTNLVQQGGELAYLFPGLLHSRMGQSPDRLAHHSPCGL